MSVWPKTPPDQVIPCHAGATDTGQSRTEVVNSGQRTCDFRSGSSVAIRRGERGLKGRGRCLLKTGEARASRGSNPLLSAKTPGLTVGVRIAALLAWPRRARRR